MSGNMSIKNALENNQEMRLILCSVVAFTPKSTLIDIKVFSVLNPATPVPR